MKIKKAITKIVLGHCCDSLKTRRLQDVNADVMDCMITPSSLQNRSSVANRDAFETVMPLPLTTLK